MQRIPESHEMATTAAAVVGLGLDELAREGARRVDDRRVVDGEKQTFRSRILPSYVRRSPKVAEVLPLLYLHGLSTGDFQPALAGLLGEDAAGLSPTAIARLVKVWEAEYAAFRRRDLSDRDYVYVWADGVHFNIRLEDDRLCTLVVIGARPDGTKEVIAVEDGYRESTESWLAVLRDLKRRGMRAPVVAVADRALGFWAAARDVWPETLAETGAFVAEYAAKYPKAVDSLTADQDRLLTHFAFPAEHWGHLRTTNPIESTFATVKLRQRVTTGAGSRP